MLRPPRKLVIVPAFNEEACIGHTIRDIRDHAPAWDIIVVNDASMDATSSVARSCGVPVLDLPFNLGIGGAMQAGFRYAYDSGYDLAAQCDADGQHPAKSLENLARPVLAGECDLAIASRFLAGRRGFRSTWPRRIGIRLLGWLLMALYMKRVADCTSGFRVVNRSLIAAFTRYYPLDYPEPEICALVLSSGKRLKEVPVEMSQRRAGASSITRLDGVFYILKVGVALLVARIRVHW